MRSIQRRFAKISQKNPYWSTYVCFAEAVKEQNFSKQTIHRWFLKLVDKNDYDNKSKKDILTQLEELSKPSVDGMK